MKPIAISIISKWEYWLKEKLAKRVPGFLTSRKLTHLSLLATVLAFFSYYLTKHNLGFLWLASFFILAQWITDTLDGEVGRYRKEGFIKWGLYVDHFFDYIFFIALTFGLYLVISQPEFLKYYIIIFIIISAFFIHVYLYAAATGIFCMSVLMLSATEIRFLIIIINTITFFFGRKILMNHWLYIALIIILLFTLLFIFIKCQHKLAKLDMKIKNNKYRKRKA